MKDFLKDMLKVFGIRIQRIPKIKLKNNIEAESITAQGQSVLSPLHHNSKERIDEFYADDEIVSNYLEPARLEFYKGVVDFILNQKILLKKQTIVDVGCGTGHLLKEIEDREPNLNLYGLEYSKSAIAQAQKYCSNVIFSEFDLYEGGNRKYDLVICCEVLEHLEYPIKAFSNLCSLVEQKGNLLITVPNGRIDTFLGHINFWSPESWKVFITENSPKGVDVIVTNINHTNVALLKFK